MLIAADSLWGAADEATDPADLIRFRYRNLSISEEAIRRYPADPEVWLDLGEARFHFDPPLGGVPAPALEAFDRAIALDPGFAPAYEHTVRLAIRLNRPDLARKYAAAYLRLDPLTSMRRSMRLAALMLDPERSHAPETARIIDSASAQVLFGAGMMQLGWWADSGESRGPAPASADPPERHRCRSLVGHVDVRPVLGARARLPGPPSRGVRGGSPLTPRPECLAFQRIPGSVPWARAPRGDPGVADRHNLSPRA